VAAGISSFEAGRSLVSAGITGWSIPNRPIAPANVEACGTWLSASASFAAVALTFADCIGDSGALDMFVVAVSIVDALRYEYSSVYDLRVVEMKEETGVDIEMTCQQMRAGTLFEFGKHDSTRVRQSIRT